MNFDPWVAVGMLGQGMFSMRFLYQWIYSERVKRSVIPEVFWYFSLGGGMILLAYAIRQRDPVFIVGQAAGLVIYIRNIWLIWREKRAGLPTPEDPDSGSPGIVQR